jgi:uncharacterized integral membrane protein (TIGR00698 family)
MRTLPGLALTALLAAAATLLAALPGAALLGPLVLALLLGIAVAHVRRPTEPLRPGIAFAARTLLRIGIVLLGVRLDARALLALGPIVLAGGAIGAVVAFAAVEAFGRLRRVPTDLRRLVAIGTAICGASAIAAALPLVQRRAGEAATPGGPAPAAIAAISLLGTLGVFGFVALDAVANVDAGLLAALAGAALQEVGQAVAAGAAVAPESDVALLVKLSRVLLLAPTLLLLGVAARRAGGVEGPRPPLVPWFVVGFLALGVATSGGALPEGVGAALALAGRSAIAAAMAAIGLGVDLRAFGRAGGEALALGAVGFVALLAAMIGWYALMLR